MVVEAISKENSTMSVENGETSPLLANGTEAKSNPSNGGPYNTLRSIRRFSARLSDMYTTHTGAIGTLGSMSIAVNSLTGPAMLNLPATFERSGIIPTSLTLVFVCILSALCCMHMSNTISKVPGNESFKKEVEFSEAFRFFWGHEWFLITQVLFFCCITCLNISSIVDTSQVVDTFLGHWWPFGGACAMQIVSFSEIQWLRWDYSMCSEDDLVEGKCIPFYGMEGVLLTGGNVVVTLIFLPLALLDLKENSIGQIVGFLILLVTCVQFTIQFWASGVTMENASWWGEDWDDLMGVVLFNFALVIVVPAWLYEREPHVNVGTVIYSSSGLSLILYLAIGILGDMAIPHVSQNMLETMMSGTMGTLMELGASIFAFAIIGLGIPLFSVLTRLNLTGSGLCTPRVGNLLAVFVPFSIAWLLNGGDSVTKLLSWGGIIFTGLVAFILPLVLAIHVTNKFDYQGSVSVYWGYFTSKRAEKISLYILMFLTTSALVVAISGNIIDMD